MTASKTCSTCSALRNHIVKLEDITKKIRNTLEKIRLELSDDGFIALRAEITDTLQVVRDALLAENGTIAGVKERLVCLMTEAEAAAAEGDVLKVVARMAEATGLRLSL